MIRPVKYLLLSTVALVSSIAVFHGCGSSTPAGAAYGYATNVTYGGSGSAWITAINNDLTFRIQKKASTSATTIDLTVTGTYTRLSSGILELTVGTSSDTTNGPSAGAKAYALDVPGYILLLKPMGSTGGEIIPMVATGTCPTADVAATWVMMQDSNTSTNYSTTGLVGTFAFANATQTATVPATRYLSDGTANVGSAENLGVLSCSSGVGTFPTLNGSLPEMYFTTAGGMVVRVATGGGNNQAIVAVPSAALTVSDFAGTYVGLAFDEGDTSNGASGGATQPVSATLNAAGTGTGAVITDVTNNTLSSTQTATLTLSQLSPTVNGALKMTLNSGSVQNTICAAAKAIGGTTQNVVFCSGPSGSGNTKLRSYLLVTKR